MVNKTKLLSILLASTLVACGGKSGSGSNSGSDTGSGTGTDGGNGGVVDTTDPFAEQRIILKVDTNNAMISYHLAPLMSSAFGDSTYKIIDNEGNDFESEYLTTNKGSEYLTVKAPIGVKEDSIDFSVKFENREGDDYSTSTVHFKALFNKEERSSGVYHYTMGENGTKVNLDLSGYSVFANIGGDPRVWDSYKGTFPQNYAYSLQDYTDCSNILSTGEFKPTGSEDKLFYSCFLFKDAEINSGLGPTQNFIDKTLVLHFTKEKAESLVSFYDNSNSDIKSYMFDNTFYRTEFNKFLFENNTSQDSITLDESNFIVPGETRKLITVLDSLGLIIKNNNIFLFNPISNKVLEVETDFKEGSNLSLIESGSYSETFAILENIDENTNKVWEINKNLVAVEKIADLGNVAETDSLKSLMRTNTGDYYSISEESIGTFVFKKNGTNASGSVTFSNNNGIIHDRYDEKVDIPVVINDVEYVYSFDGSSLSPNSNINIDALYNRIETLEMQIVEPPVSVMIHNEKMSFSGINYMKKLYSHRNGDLEYMVLHELNNINHQEFFKVSNSQGLDETVYNMKKYIAEGGTAQGIPSQVFVFKEIVTMNGNNYAVMNKNGVDVFQHQNGENAFSNVEDVQVVQGKKLNILSVKGDNVMHYCLIDDVLESANHQLNGVSESHSDMSLIGEKLVYISNGMLQEMDISGSNCK